MSATPLLAVESLTVRYGPITALTEVSLQVSAGELVAIVGANGAGKSTLLRTVSGLERPVGGHVLLDGEDITDVPPAHRVARGVIQVPEGRELFGSMTAMENLQLGALAGGSRGAIDEDIWTLFPQLYERRRQRADSMSGGEQQMLALARGLLGKPRVLLLDEPSLGLAPVIVRQIMDLLKRLHGDGMTIVLVEQNANMALAISDRAYVLDTGRVRMDGPSSRLLQNDEIRRTYLGAVAA